MSLGYETLIIAHPEISDEELTDLGEKLTDAITQNGGEVLKIDRWGKRKLVYKIKGLSKGYFFVTYFLGNPLVLPALDKLLRYNEKVLRYQNLRLAKKVDLESLREKESAETKEVAAPVAEEENQDAKEDQPTPSEEVKEEAGA